MRYSDFSEPVCECTGTQQIEEAVGDEAILNHLVNKYAEFNDAYFGGSLPGIPISWGRMKNSGAAVTYTIAKRGTDARLLPETLKMVFSTKYKRDAVQLEPLLLHEMIHVYFVAVENDLYQSHGVKFLSKLKEVSIASGIAIPLKDDTADLKLASEVVKPIGVILRRYRSGGELKTGYAMFSARMLVNTAKLADIEKLFARRFNELVEARIVTSPLWWEKSERSALQRTIGYKTNFFVAKPEEIDDLLANSRIVWSNGGSYNIE